MTNKISQKEWEALSAYLDNQLGPRERRRIETSIRDDPRLQEGLEYLKVTRSLVRSLPRYRAPRNFTLTPEMVGLRRPNPVSPGLRLVAVAATMMFFIIIMSDLLISRISSPMMPVPASAPQEILNEAFSVDLETQESSSPDLRALEAPKSAPPGLGDIEETTTLSDEAAPMLLESAEVDSSQEEALSTLQEPAGSDQEAVMESAPLLRAESTASPVANPTQENQSVFVEPTPVTPTEDIQVTLPAPGLIQSIYSQPPLRFLELGIGLLAIFLWVIVLLLRRR